MEEDIVLFENYSYQSAFVGVTHDGRAVYDFEKMVEYLINEKGFEDELAATEWIEYNTLRSIPYAEEKAPVVVFPIEYEFCKGEN